VVGRKIGYILKLVIILVKLLTLYTDSKSYTWGPSLGGFITVEKIDAVTNTHKRQLTAWKYINYHKNQTVDIFRYVIVTNGNVEFIRKLIVPVQKSLYCNLKNNFCCLQ
jgi:hypothetical protein